LDENMSFEEFVAEMDHRSRFDVIGETPRLPYGQDASKCKGLYAIAGKDCATCELPATHAEPSGCDANCGQHPMHEYYCDACCINNW